MRNSKHFLIGFICVAFLVGTVGWMMPPESQALDLKGGFQFKKILKAIFPPCGPGTRHERFVVSKDGKTVCDNKTGLWWEQRPSSSFFDWQGAKDRCTNLTLSGKKWRLAKVKEYISLEDFSKPNQAAALNKPNGPFENVQSAFYWSATPDAGNPMGAWDVFFGFGGVSTSPDDSSRIAWCVSDGKKTHAH